MEKKKTTLFDFLRFKREQQDPEIECPIANPLNFRFDHLFNIKSVVYLNLDFQLTAIEEYTRYVNNTDFMFTDYTLLERNEKQKILKLRCVENDLLLLTQIESMAYDQGLEEVLKETDVTHEFQINDDVKNTTYTRVNNLKGFWNATVKKLVDKDGNGKITKLDPVMSSKIKYWDFWRDEQESTEMLFIEMDKETGWITMWQGYFIDSENIIVI